MQFPRQDLTRKEKIKKYGTIEKWVRNTCDAINYNSDLYWNGANSKRYEKQAMYDLVEDNIDEYDFENTLQPYGKNVPKYPVSIRNYNRIKNDLNTLLGEEIAKPFNFRARAVNNAAVTEEGRKKKAELYAALEEKFRADMESLLIMNGGSVGITPEEAQKEYDEIMNRPWQDDLEITANHVLNYLKNDLYVKDKFNDGYYDLMNVGDEVYYTGIENGEPALRRVFPLNFDFDRSPDIKYIDEAGWAREWRWMSASAVYKAYDLTNEQKSKVEQIKGFMYSYSSSAFGSVYLHSNDYVTGGRYFDSNYPSNTGDLIQVVNYTWVSMRQVKFVTYRDLNSGEILEKMCDEDYKLVDEEGDISEETKWINEVWEATRIGEDIFVNIGPRPNQYRSVDNPQSCRLPYTGVSNLRYSIVKQVKHLQYLFNVIMWYLEMALKRAKGKMMVMDVSMIPTRFQGNLEKWIHFADLTGFVFVNGAQEGMQQLRGNIPQQWKEIDMTLSSAINQYVNILSYLDTLIEDITGISRQRQGRITSSESVGNVQQTIVGSTAVTEYISYIHRNVKQRVLTNLLEEAKLAWLKGKKSAYISDDGTNAIMEVDGTEFPNSDYAVFVVDSFKDRKLKDTLDQLALAAMQNNQVKFKDVVSLLDNESVASAKNMLDESYKQIAEEQIQQSKFKEEQENMRLQEKENRADARLQMKIAGDLEKVKIQALGFAEDKDVNQNRVPDVLEHEKLAAKKDRDQSSERFKEEQLRLKNKQLHIEDKKIETDKELTEKELAVKMIKGTGI